MDKRHIIAAGVIWMTVGGAHALALGQKAGACSRQPVMPVLVHNYASVPLEVLRDAQAYTSRIYKQIGVTIQWLEPGPGRRDALWAAYTVVLMTPEAARRKAQEDRLPDDVVGQAAAVARRAYIHYDRVVDMAVTPGRDIVTFLGYVVAHELGHLLLPGRRHAPAGIMRESFPLTTRSIDSFTAAELALICERLENDKPQLRASDGMSSN